MSTPKDFESKKSLQCCADHCCTTKCFSGGAIVIGAIVMIGLLFLVDLFGIAIGLSAYTPSKAGATTLAVGGFIGMLIGVMIVTFIAGSVSGFLGRGCCQSKCLGIIYGFSAWALGLIVSILLVSSVGDFINRQNLIIINGSGALIQAIGNRAAENKASQTEAQGNQGKLGAVASSAIGHAVMNGVQNAKEEQMANAAGKSLLLTFILFFVGAIMASYGGYVGTRSIFRHKKDKQGS